MSTRAEVTTEMQAVVRKAQESLRQVEAWLRPGTVLQATADREVVLIQIQWTLAMLQLAQMQHLLAIAEEYAQVIKTRNTAFEGTMGRGGPGWGYDRDVPRKP